MELRLLNLVFAHDKREVRTFPGALPISISRKELKDIAFGYVWSVKADGNREFLFIDEKKSKQVSWWTLGRDLKTNCAPPELNTNSVISIFDVEVCDDIIYIFDSLMVRNVVTIRKCVLERIDAAYAMLTDFPQHTQTKWWWDDLKSESTMTPTKYNRNTCCILPGSTMKLVVKPFFLYGALPDIWSIVSQRLLNDGIIFTRLFQKYESYRSAPLSFIKWKPRDLITIDTVIRDNSGRSPGVIFGIPMDFSFATKGNVLLCITRTATSGVTRSGKSNNRALSGLQDTPFAHGNVDEIKFDLESIDSKVGEFAWDGTAWNLHRLRDDKTKSNTIDTICKTIENLRDVIEFSEL
jgi:hypothetical protein